MDALFQQAEALEDAEAVLLVDDREAQLVELDVFFEQRVRADGHLRQALGHQLFELRLFAAGG